MRAQQVRIGNLAVSRFPYVACKTVQCDGLPRLLGRAEATVVISKRANGDAKPVQARRRARSSARACGTARAGRKLKRRQEDHVHTRGPRAGKRATCRRRNG
eukprot:1906801-Pleurochrysis_carterae.AAC.1